MTQENEQSVVSDPPTGENTPDQSESSSEKLVGAVRLLAGMAVFAFLSFIIIDTVMTDDIVPLIWCRLGACSLLLITAGLTWTHWGRAHGEWLGGAICLITGCTVTVLTEMTGGPSSPYWTMVMLTFFGVAVVLPMRRSRATLYFGSVAFFYPIWMLANGLSLSDVAGVTSCAGIVLALCVSVLAVGFLDNWRLRDARQTSALVTLNAKLRREMADRTEAERRQRAMEAQIRESQKIDAVGQLASGMAHELNNVLTTIMCTADMVRQTDNDPGNLDAALARVLKAAERGSKLTTDLLGFARRGSRNRAVFSVNQTAGEVVDLMKRTHRGRAIFITHLAHDLPPVAGDPYLLFQALVNLALNAIQAMDDTGTITVTTKPGPSKEGAPCGTVQILVEDQGRGMAAEERMRAFEPFFTTKAADKGTGLGLSMVYGTAQEFGGNVTLHSTAGEGTTVIVTLPGVDEDLTKEVAKMPTPAKPCAGAVLVVDDDELVRDLLVELLQQAGLEVKSASNGREGLAAYLERTEGFELVVIDMIMPEIDGPALMRRILEIDPGQRALLVSGYADQAVIEPLLESRRRRFLRKPFTPRSLLETVSDLLPTDDEGPTDAPLEAIEAASPHVLVVEDHAVLRKLTRGALEAIGMTVTVVESGEKALDACLTDDFNIVLLDLRLPGWSGTETAKRIRSALPEYETPIVGLSGQVGGNERDACLAAGMNGFLAKPFTIDQLRAAIEAHL